MNLADNARRVVRVRAGCHALWTASKADMAVQPTWTVDSVASDIMGRTICALGDAAAMPVRAMLKHFRHEFEYHVEHKTCMVPAYV